MVQPANYENNNNFLGGPSKSESLPRNMAAEPFGQHSAGYNQQQARANYDNSSMAESMSNVDLGEPPMMRALPSSPVARARRSATSLARDQYLRASVFASMDENLNGMWAPPGFESIGLPVMGAHNGAAIGSQVSVNNYGDQHLQMTSNLNDDGQQDEDPNQDPNQSQSHNPFSSKSSLGMAKMGNNLSASRTYLGSALEEMDEDEDDEDDEQDDELTPHLSLEHEAQTGFELAWLNLRYSVKPNLLENPRWGKLNRVFHKHPRQILKGISGGLRSGQFVALMGPSGAGKTCLLECIAGIRRTGQEGRLCIRGRKKAQLVIVPQYDNFLPEFTVEEIISYGSRMKNPIDSNHRQIVDSVIAQLGLKGCRRNKIKNCSGGQQKRVAIAQELVSKPNILILDEPSSGLDSSICYQTMKVLRQVLDASLKSSEPMAIVTTIHQPSAKVFRMFDLVYVLGKEGYFAYSGPPGCVVETIRSATGFECPKFSNPADFIIELISYDYGREPVDELMELEIEKGRRFELEFDARRGVGKKKRRSLWKSASIMSLARKSFTGRGGSKRSKAGSLAPNKKQDKQAADSKPDGDNQSLGAQSTGTGLNSSQFSSGGKLRSAKSETQLSRAGSKLISILKSGPGAGKGKSPKEEQQEQQQVKASNTSLNFKYSSQTNLSSAGNELVNLKRPYVTYKLNVVNDLIKATSNEGAQHPFLWHLYLHCHRSILQSMRDPILNRMRFIFHVCFAVLIVILFGRHMGNARGCPPVMGLSLDITDPNHENIVDLGDNVGFIFICMMMITYVSLMTMTLTFPLEIKTVCVEYKNGWYGVSTFFLGKTIGDIPFILVYPMIFCAIAYYSTGQPTDTYWRPAYFTILMILHALNSQTLGLIMGAIFVNSITAATFLGPVSTIPWYLFTGFPKRIPYLPPPLRKISKYMFTRHIFDGLLQTMFGFDRCNCTGWVEEYYQKRDEETLRLGQLVSVENLLALDYYEDLEDPAKRLGIEGDASGPPAPAPIISNAGQDPWDRWEQPDLFKIMEKNTKADNLFGFGLDFEPNCPANYTSFVTKEFNLSENSLRNAIVIALVTLFALRFLTFVIVNYKIRTRELG